LNESAIVRKIIVIMQLRNCIIALWCYCASVSRIPGTKQDPR
jgi:hypothetical protein